MNQPNPERKSQTQDISAKDIIVGRDFTIAPKQIDTYIETQIVEISAEKVTQQPLTKASPYKGLKRFNFGDREYFFGRDALIARLFKVVNKSSFSLVLGASGSGKSSVVRAGLIPELKKSLESQKFYDFIFTPNQDPFESLYRCLLSEEKDYSFRESEAKIALKPRPETLPQVISTLKKDEERWLLFIDQFEQLFTICTDLEKRKNFIEGIVQVAKEGDSSVRIVLAMRSDFLEQFSFYPTLGAIANQNNIHLVTEMYPDELRQAIEQPAAKHGVVFEKGLVEQIIEEVEGQKGYLPLLQYTLNLLWERECTTKAFDGRPHIEDRTLNKTSYSALEGVRGALQKRVNEIYKDICENNKDGELVTKQIFLKLVSIIESDSGSRPVSRRAYRYEFVGEPVESTLKRFIDEKLLVSSYEYSSEDELLIGKSTKHIEHATIEIAHEILLSSWNKLKRWLEEEKEAIILKNWLAGETRRWLEVLAKDESKANDELLKGSRLEQIVALREKNAFEKLGGLVKEENQFIDASVDWRERALAETKRLQRRAIKWLSGGLTAALIAAGVAGWQWRLSELRGQIAISRQLATQAELKKISPHLSILFATESMRRFPSGEAAQILYQGFALLPHLVARIEHNKSVKAVTFSADGKYVATVSDDNTIQAWEVNTGREIARMAFKEKEESRVLARSEVIALAFSSDGIYFAAPKAVNKTCVWEIKTARQIACMSHEHKGIPRESFIRAVAFSPDGNYLATASDDTTVRIWETSTGRQISRMSHNDKVSAVTFSMDGKYLATVSDNRPWLWKVANSQKLTPISRQNKLVDTIAISSNAKYLAGGEIRQVIIPGYESLLGHLGSPISRVSWVWNAITGKEVVRIIHKDNINALAFTPDSKFLAIAAGNTGVWKTDTGHQVARMTHQGKVTSLVFSSDGKYLATAGSDKTVRIWEPTAKQVVTQMAHENKAEDIWSIAFSSDGRYLATASTDKTARIWKTNTGEEIARIPHEDGVNGITFSPDGKYLATASFDHTARVWELTSNREVAQVKHDRDVTAVAFSSDGKYLATASFDRTARVWEVTSGREVARMTHKKSVAAIAFSPDNKYLATAKGAIVQTGAMSPIFEDNLVQVWNVKTGQEVTRVAHEFIGEPWYSWKSQVSSIAFSPNGKYLATASYDNTARVWEVTSGREITRMKHEDDINTLTFSPNGKYLATASDDNTARVWEVTSGRQITYKPHDDRVINITFSLDSKYLATTSFNGTARVWERNTAREVARIPRSVDVNFSPDGHYLATASVENTALIWFWKPQDLISEACKRLTRNFTEKEWQQYLPEEPYRKTCPNLP